MTHTSISLIFGPGKLNRIKFRNFPGFSSPAQALSSTFQSKKQTELVLMRGRQELCTGDLKDNQCGNVNLKLVSYLLPLDIESGGCDRRCTGNCH